MTPQAVQAQPRYVPPAILDRATAARQPLLSKEEELELIDRWKTDRCRESLQRLTISFGRIAHSVARAYAPRDEEAQRCLAQEGLLGIMHAADQYDATKGLRFAQYAKWWVKTGVSQAAADALLPVHIPTRRYMDARMGRLGNDVRSSVLLVQTQPAQSLDAPVGGHEDAACLGDTVECNRYRPDRLVEKSHTESFFVDEIRAAMAVLKPREAEVVRRRRLSDPAETLEAIAEDLGVTRERVRQIEVSAIAKMTEELLDRGFPVDILLP